MVLLKSVDDAGFVFFTDYRSRKGVELSGNARASLCFWWDVLQRQVRVEGTVARVAQSESAEYYRTRPHGSRLGAWASPQSEVITSRAVLVANAAKVSARDLLNPPRPPHWGGFRLVADRWEFWQGRRSRLHDRLVYRLVEDAWQRERLAP